MIGIVLEGEAAVAERKRLLESGKEIPVALRKRDASGKQKSTWLQFGMNASAAWVYCRDEDESTESRIVLEAVLANEAGELFQGYIERMMLRRCLVDPSALSGEFVEISPCFDDAVTDLRNEFRVALDPWR